jgi:hypothetical protein
MALALGIGLLMPAPAGTAAKRAKAATGDDWPEITAAEKSLKKLEQDPEADAVVLSRERTGKIVRKADDWVNVLNYHRRFKILTKAGKRLGEIEIPAGKYSRVSNIRARTVKADGTVVPVASDQIFEKVVTKARGYKRTEWVFNFPAVEPGAILEYSYDRHVNFLYYIDPWYFEGRAYTLRSKVTQAIPNTMGYSILCDLCPSEVKPIIEKWREGKAKGQLYSMELTNLPGYRGEILMPPAREVSPRMEMVLHTWKGYREPALGRVDGFFTDWDSVAKFTSYYYEEAIKKGRDKLRPLVQGWVQGISDPEEKINTILRHIREDFEYESWDRVGGWSDSIEKILKEKRADNEEKAVLLRAALQVIGVESNVVLVVGKHLGSLNPNFTSLSQFSHAVVAVPQDGGYRWLDPTITCAPDDFVPWQDSGAQALLLKKTGGELLDLPVKNEMSTARYRVTVKPQPDGRAGLDIEAEFRGEDAIDMRDTLLPLGDDARERYLQKWLDGKRDGAVLASHTIEALEEFDEPLVINMKAEAPGLVTVADGVLAVRGCVLNCYDVNPLAHGERVHPLYVDRGWNWEETVLIEAPEGMAAAPGPSPIVTRTAVARMSFRCSPQGEAGIRCTRQFLARRSRWPASEFTKVRDMFDQIVQADQTRIAFQTR